MSGQSNPTPFKLPNCYQFSGGTNRQTNNQKSPCVLQDFGLFGAAAQKKEERVEEREEGWNG